MMTEWFETLVWILEKLNPIWKSLLHPSAHLYINSSFYHQSIAFWDNLHQREQAPLSLWLPEEMHVGDITF